MKLPSATAITHDQWYKVLKALYYSAGSGFVGGFILGLAGLLSSGGTHDLPGVLGGAVVTGGLVGALNSVAVTLKQLFTESESPQPSA